MIPSYIQIGAGLRRQSAQREKRRSARVRQLELASGFGIHADPGPINCSDGAGKTYGGHPIGADGDCIHDMLIQECLLDGLVVGGE